MSSFRDAEFRSQEHVTEIWALTPPADTSVDDLLKPENWAHLAAKLRVGAEIVVKPEGLPYRALLIVLDVGKGYAKVRLLNIVLLNDAGTAEAPKADPLPQSLAADAPVFVRWNPGSKKYSIYRRSDGERIHDGFVVKDDATGWAIGHIAAMAA